jgi:uncharacterized protein YqhQ
VAAKKELKKPPFNVGGEAVIEGVMMRSPHFYAVAVRNPAGKIVTMSERVNSAAEKYPFLKWPFLRGLISMYESMSLGFKALSFSAAVFEKGTEAKPKTSGKTKTAVKTPKKSNEALDVTVSFVFAIVLAIGLFILLPYGLNKLLAKKFHEIGTNRYLFNTGMVFFKLVIFFFYVWGISFFDDVKRLFMYHGSEHKSIYAFEDGKKLDYKNIAPYSTRHPRCGTAFIIVTLIISLIIFVLVLPAQLNPLQRILFELPLLIPIVSISYELLKLSDKFRGNFFMKLFIAPGLAFQRLTTKEPDAKMVEVAVASLQTAVKLEMAWISKQAKAKKAAKK